MNPSDLPSPALREILDLVASGNLSVNDAVRAIDSNRSLQIENATVDLGRATRCRFGEVIYGEGKSVELITEIAKIQLQHGQSVFVTRVTPDDAAQLISQFAHSHYVPLARTLRLANVRIEDAAVSLSDDETVFVAVVTAGSTDDRVAAEAVQTLRWMNVAVDEIRDVGVAGPQRLLAVVPRIRRASAIVVVAGMEAALASVVGGHVGCPVVAVPTSVGYGTSFGGVTALLGMLSSCASNVTVVGIDAGFKGGYVSGLIATQIKDARQFLKQS